MTFPTTAEGKRVAMQRMKSAAPELMDDIAELRAAFGGTLTYFSAPGIEYGTPAPEGWQVDQELLNRVRGPEQLTTEQQERIRKDKIAAARRKGKK